MKKLTKMMVLLFAVVTTFTACSKDEPDNGSDGKAKIDNLAISPSSNLKYGDNATLTGSLSDDVGLNSYTVKISNAGGDIFESMTMLTGRTFNLNQQLVIPLPKNASAGNLTLSLTVKNSRSQLTTQEIQLQNVALPTFSKLYLVMNSVVYEMTKNGNVFEYENSIPVGATGKIYVNADKSGIFWGLDNGEIKTLGNGDIVFGKENEEFFKISFNPVSFELQKGAAQDWTSMTGDDLYVLGTISGNWEDNACCWDNYQNEHGIIVEMAKMKMTAESLGNKKRWTWKPSEDMWGNTVAGIFRLKKAGKEQYILYSNGQIVTSSNNSLTDDNFIIPVGGKFNIRVMGDETGITSVTAFDDELGKALEFKSGEVLLNGMSALPTISFAGNGLSLVPGNYFVYQGTINLTNNQSVTGDGIDLSALFSDPDIFPNGQGNKTWRFTGPTSSYYILIDAFSGHVYLRETIGYPTTIYMDGWSWKKYSGDPRTNWNTGTEMTLYQVGTSSVYEGTCYVQPWSGDIKFFAKPSTDSNVVPSGVISAQYFNLGSGQAIMTDNVGLMLPVPAGDGAYYKVSVDLKDGLNIDEAGAVTPKGAKFTFSFTPL